MQRKLNIYLLLLSLVFVGGGLKMCISKKKKKKASKEALLTYQQVSEGLESAVALLCILQAPRIASLQ